jgi:hypothetical protein
MNSNELNEFITVGDKSLVVWIVHFGNYIENINSSINDSTWEEKRIMKQIDIPNEIKNRSNSIAYDFRQLLERKKQKLTYN